MCDYSLAEYNSRIASVNETLVAHKFSTGSIGLIAAGELVAAGNSHCAVCIPPGAKLRISDLSEDIQKTCGVGSVEDVTFVQTSMAVGQHRDAVQFSNGQIIKLQVLTPGQERVLVLSLDGKEIPETTEPAHESEAELVSAGTSGGRRRRGILSRFLD